MECHRLPPQAESLALLTGDLNGVSVGIANDHGPPEAEVRVRQVGHSTGDESIPRFLQFPRGGIHGDAQDPGLQAHQIVSLLFARVSAAVRGDSRNSTPGPLSALNDVMRRRAPNTLLDALVPLHSFRSPRLSVNAACRDRISGWLRYSLPKRPGRCFDP